MNNNFKLKKWYYGVSVVGGDVSIDIGQLADEDIILFLEATMLKLILIFILEMYMNGNVI